MLTSKFLVTIPAQAGWSATDYSAALVQALPRTLEALAIDLYEYRGSMLGSVVVTGFASRAEVAALPAYVERNAGPVPVEVATTPKVWKARD